MAVVITNAKGIDGANYTPNSYAEFNDMIGKVADQYIREVEAKNPLAVFDKRPIDNGDTIEQAVVKLVEATSYDATGAGALTRDTRVKLAVKYFKDFNRYTYKTTVDRSKIRKVLVGERDASSVAEMLVSVLGQSEIYDKYQFVKSLLLWGTTAASYDNTNPVLIHATDVPLASGKTDYKGILKRMKDIVSGMQFVNADFNRAGVKRATRSEDIFIMMPYTLKNAIDVDELAGVFNLDKAELKSKIIEIDDTSNKYVYIVDRQAVLVYTRLREMVNQLNADGLFYNFFLHVENMFAISPLFDGCFFEYDTQAQA